jgi:hypothetical protein
LHTASKDANQSTLKKFYFGFLQHVQTGKQQKSQVIKSDMCEGEGAGNVDDRQQIQKRNKVVQINEFKVKVSEIRKLWND